MEKYIVVCCDDRELYKVGGKSEICATFNEAHRIMKEDFLKYAEDFHPDEYDKIKENISNDEFEGDGWAIYDTTAFIGTDCHCADWKIIELEI